MRGEFEADFIRHTVKRQHRVIKVNLVGMIIIPELLRALEKLLQVGRVRNATALSAIPFPLQRGADFVTLRVKILRIEAVPPKPLAVGLRQFAVVRYDGERAGFVRALCHFIPRPRARGVNADAETQTIVPRCRRPAADQILVRADVDGIPRLVFGIEVV